MLRDLLSDLIYRLRALFRRGAVERDLAAELEFHVDHETERLVREGHSPAEARRRAQVAFGGVEQVKETARDARGVRAAENLGRDLLHALRLTRRQPGFSAVVMLSLALGLGAALTVFNLTWNVLYAPLPLPHPEQLVSPVRWNADGRDVVFTWTEVEALKSATAGVSLAAMRGASAVSVGAGGRPAYINLTFVEGNFFALLGATAREGRLISPRDDAEAAPVVVLAEDFARALFAGDSAVVGKSVNIRGAFFTVIGVTPRSFRGVSYPGTFTAAIPIGSASLLGANGVGHDNRGIPYGAGDPRPAAHAAFQLVGRITTDFRSARTALAAVFAGCCASSATGQREWLELVDIRRGIPGGKGDNREEVRGTLAMVLGGVALVLVVVCCNVASLLLVRAASRQREIAVRLALGASRVRLTGQIVLESVPAAVVGTLAGAVFAAWFTAAFARGLPEDWGYLRPMAEFRVNLPLVATTVSLALACTLAFAVYPALRATARPLVPSLRLDARASRGRRDGAVVRWVIVAQVAVTLVIATAAGLLSATLMNLTRTDSGIARDHMLLAGLGVRSTMYEAGGILPIAERIARSVEAVPGVRAVTMATQVPLYGGSNYAVWVKVPGFTPAQGREPMARLVVARPGYFATAGMSLLAGRGLLASDASAGSAAAVVSLAFVRQYLGGGEPVGRTFEIAIDDDRKFAPVQIVGVVRDATYESPRERALPYVYLSIAQPTGAWRTMPLVVRTAGDPMALAPAVLDAVEAAAPGIEVRRVRDMETQHAWSTTTERLTARLAVFASMMALVLAAIGLYGVVAFEVSRRTSEIGVRLALGAGTGGILWLVSRETLWRLGGGVLLGVVLSYGATGAMRSQFFGVGPHEPLATIGAVLALALVGTAASVLPARRAARIDPRIALNAD
jgi:predicted permease